MSESDPAIIGVESCGCVTLAIARPDRDRELSAKDRREEDRTMAEIIRKGGQVLRTTVGEARAMPDFLPMSCPHNPKGWGS